MNSIGYGPYISQTTGIITDRQQQETNIDANDWFLDLYCIEIM